MMCVRVYLRHFSIRQRLTQHCKSGLLQFKTKQNKTELYPNCWLVFKRKSIFQNWHKDQQLFRPFILLRTTISIYIPREVTFC